MHLVNIQANNVVKQPFCQPMLAHDGGCTLAALRRELQTPVGFDHEEVIALHPAHRLAYRGAGLFQALDNAGAKRGNAFLFELVDGSKIHFGCINKFLHSGQPFILVYMFSD